jgi:TRAP transporter TAXI family solute receptor
MPPVQTTPTAPVDDPSSEAGPPEVPPIASLQRLLMVTGGTAGVYYPFGGVIAATITEHLNNVEITATSSGASVANVRSLAAGDSDIAMVQNDILNYGYNGILMFEPDGPMANLRTMAALYPEVVQIVAIQASGITSVEDLRGKRVSVGDAGSGTEANARQVLEAHGMSFDDFARLENLSFGESASAMQNANIDAAFITSGAPAAAVTELNTTVDITIVPITGAGAQRLMSTFQFYAPYTITDAAYTGVPATETVSVLASLAISTDMDDVVAYWLTRTLFERQPQIAIGHARGLGLSPENAILGASVPFHPGAERYYIEIGVK